MYEILNNRQGISMRQLNIAAVLLFYNALRIVRLRPGWLPVLDRFQPNHIPAIMPCEII